MFGEGMPLARNLEISSNSFHHVGVSIAVDGLATDSRKDILGTLCDESASNGLSMRLVRIAPALTLLRSLTLDTLADFSRENRRYKRMTNKTIPNTTRTMSPIMMYSSPVNLDDDEVLASSLLSPNRLIVGAPVDVLSFTIGRVDFGTSTNEIEGDTDGFAVIVRALQVGYLVGRRVGKAELGC